MATENQPVRPDDSVPRRAEDGDASPHLPLVRIFFASLGILLLGYMFLGRGFAHLGSPPVYVGDIILALGLTATAFAIARGIVRVAPSRIVYLLIGLMALGAVRTVPYIGQFGLDALRDATLWGYGFFALIVFALADRALVLRAFRLYGWVVPVFALWLPVSYNVFAFLSRFIDPNAQGTSVPLVFFKGGDMAVHIVGAIAFLVLGGTTVLTSRSVLLRVIVAVPLLWIAFVAGAANRGALITVVLGLAVVVLLAPRSRNWLPLLLATVVLAVGLAVQGAVLTGGSAPPALTAGSTAVASQSPALLPTGLSDASAPISLGTSASGQPTSRPSAAATRAGDSPTPQSSTGELVPVTNGDFELGPPGGSILGWTPFGVGKYSIVGEGGYRDTRFAQVDNTGGAYQATLTSSRFPFTGGQDIKVSLWAKAVRASPTVEIYLNWYDVAGRRISSVFLQALSTGGSGVWREVTGTAAAPPETTHAEVLLWEAAGNAALGIDEVTVRAGDFIPKLLPPKGRPATLGQLIENIFSVFGSSSDQGLEGTKQFRLAWWGTIIDYTVRGDYFWTGKGFGINLADADGFQTTVDHSLRAPHNSHVTILARMGVPGLVLWLLVQVGFGVGLLRTTLRNRRAGDLKLAAIGGWLLAYWVAMMVDTSFDPYLEGPQGGIWFWTVVGLGLVVMRLSSRRDAA